MSIRFFALLAICVAVALLYSGAPGETTVSRSERELDFAIVGHGYFVVSDFNTGNVGYTRAGGMTVNEFGQLVVNAGSKEWCLDPPIQVPSDWERIAVQHDGNVQCLAGGFWSEIGQIQLARFMRTPAFAIALAVNSSTDDSGPPTIGAPFDTQSIIQQGWIEARRSSLAIITRNLLLALLASIVVNTFVVQGGTKSHNSTEH